MAPVRRLVAIVASVLWTCGPAAALLVQAGQPATGTSGADAEPLVLHAYSLRYQQAIEAIPLIQPLLTSRGTLELQPGGNTLVIRDTNAALARIVPQLRAFDHPAQAIRVEIQVVRASRNLVSPPARHSDLADALTRQLRQLLPYDIYELQAQAQLSSQEGQAVAYDMGKDYEVTFRVGTLLDGKNLRLSNFTISRRAPGPGRRPVTLLAQGSLMLCLDQTISVGLTRSEGSREAQLFIVTARRDTR